MALEPSWSKLTDEESKELREALEDKKRRAETERLEPTRVSFYIEAIRVASHMMPPFSGGDTADYAERLFAEFVKRKGETK